MDTLNRKPGFRYASMATAERIMQAIRNGADAFGDDPSVLDRPVRLTAAARLERMRQRRTRA